MPTTNMIWSISSFQHNEIESSENWNGRSQFEYWIASQNISQHETRKHAEFMKQITKLYFVRFLFVEEIVLRPFYFESED